jgi:hypothetical protein
MELMSENTMNFLSMQVDMMRPIKKPKTRLNSPTLRLMVLVFPCPRVP